MNLKCYCCGADGHSSTTCNKKEKIPRSDWYVNRAMSNMQKGSKTKVKFKTEKKNEKSNENDNDQDDDEDSVVKSWCTFQYGKKLMRN